MSDGIMSLVLVWLAVIWSLWRVRLGSGYLARQVLLGNLAWPRSVRMERQQ